MVVDVLEVCADDVAVVSAEVLEEDCDFQGVLVAQVARCVSGTTQSSSHVIVISHFVLGFDILSRLPAIELEGSMTEAALH